MFSSKMMLKILTLLAGAAVITALNNTDESMQHCDRFLGAQKFCNDGVVPDVLPTTPQFVLQASFCNDSRNTVDLGNRLTRDAAKKVPNVVGSGQVPTNANGTMYTFVMVDPDVPSRANHTKREILHWLIVDQEQPVYPQPLNACDSIQDKNTVVCYRGPGPSPGTGYHRYIIIMYQQSNGGPIRNQIVNPPRFGFNVTQFAQQYSLKLMAANYFTAKNPDE